MGRDAYKTAFDRSHESIEGEGYRSLQIVCDHPACPVWGVSNA